MLEEPLRDRKDAAPHLQTGGIRASRKRDVQLAKVGGRHRTVPSRHGLERRIELRGQTRTASDAAQLDDRGTYGKRRHELCALNTSCPMSKPEGSVKRRRTHRQASGLPSPRLGKRPGVVCESFRFL